ncbi:MAG TPA: hypothetical protein HA263_03545 [Methanoregulaceae archaeon]|nr:hypothetical protein [Methanoregulaceae archaeon]
MELNDSVIPILTIIIGFGSIIASIFVVIIQHKTTQLREIREKLRGDRRQIYKASLYPFIILFSKEENREMEARAFLNSKEYRENSIMLNLIGSDDVILANNRLLKSFSEWPEIQGGTQEEIQNQTFKIIREFAQLLLAIRVSLLEVKTKIGYREMVIGMFPWLDENF